MPPEIEEQIASAPQAERQDSLPVRSTVASGVLAYWFDIAPAVTREWLDWYLRDHMPSRVGTTFVSGRCYEAISASRSHMVLFDTGTPEALLAPSYLSLLKVVTDDERRRRGWYTETIRVTCRCEARSGRGVGSVLGVLRIAGAGASVADIGDCLVDEVMPALAAAPGVGAAWIIRNDPALRERMDAVRLTGHADGSADWAVLIEAGHDDALLTAFASLDGLPAWNGTGMAQTAVRDRFRLLYSMTQSDHV